MFCVEVHTSKGFPGGSDSTRHAGDLGLIPGLERSPGEGHGNPLQYSCLENSYGQRSLTGYSPWGCKESDITEWLSTAQHTSNRYRVEEGVGLALEALEVPHGSDRLIPGFGTPRGLGRLPAECSQKEWSPFFASFPISSPTSAMEVPPQFSGCCWRERGCSSHFLHS